MGEPRDLLFVRPADSEEDFGEAISTSVRSTSVSSFKSLIGTFKRSDSVSSGVGITGFVQTSANQRRSK